MRRETTDKISYGEGIRQAFHYLLSRYPEVFLIGQGLWSPWYVGNTMTGLDKEFGVDRVIDTPVSEASCTGVAIGASLCGYRSVVIHPRMDFMILAIDTIVNQAAKWRHMLGGKSGPSVTIRSIINRGGEQGAQHSQALHSWFAHVPGLRVVTPATPQDARDLLVASVLCEDPVVYIDDRWLYDVMDDVTPLTERDLRLEGSRVLKEGRDLTLVGNGHTTQLCVKAAEELSRYGVSSEVIDLRVLNPLELDPVLTSAQKTGRLLVADGGWSSCGLAGEVIAGVTEKMDPLQWHASPRRLTLPPAPAPTSKVLEDIYYLKKEDIVTTAMDLVGGAASGRVRQARRL